MAEISAREKRAAEAWMVKMLDDPVAHREAFNAWAWAAPGRLEYYEQLLGSVQAAGRAARSIRIDRPAATPGWRGWSILVPAIAAMVIVISIGAYFALGSLAPVEQPSPVPVAKSKATRIGEVRQEKLEDGSTIILDTNSEIAANFTSGSRRIDLKRGRARFIVAHDGTRPFVVVANGNEVMATGTIFDVTLRGGFGVHLLNGSVQVKLRNAAYAGPVVDLRLLPGQQISIFDGQSEPPSAMPARQSDEQWVNGVKSFDDVPIKDVIAEANSYSTTQIVLADPSLGSREIFGDINIRDVEAVAKAIADYLQLRIDRSQPGKLVLAK